MEVQRYFGGNELHTGECKESFTTATPNPLALDSTVAHISMVIGGIMTLNYWGDCRSFALMVAHGLCSFVSS